MASDLEQRVIRLEMALNAALRRLEAAMSLAERAWNRPSPPWGGGGGGGTAFVVRYAFADTDIDGATDDGDGTVTLGTGVVADLLDDAGDSLGIAGDVKNPAIGHDIVAGTFIGLMGPPDGPYHIWFESCME